MATGGEAFKCRAEVCGVQDKAKLALNIKIDCRDEGEGYCYRFQHRLRPQMSLKISPPAPPHSLEQANKDDTSSVLRTICDLVADVIGSNANDISSHQRTNKFTSNHWCHLRSRIRSLDDRADDGVFVWMKTEITYVFNAFYR